MAEGDKITMIDISFFTLSFWLSIIYVFIVTFGYPVLLLTLVAFRRHSHPKYCEKNEFPAVTMIISAFNEEDVIESKIENSFAIDYPRDKIEILVASDGSEDRTNEIVLKYSDKGVRLLSYGRMGKTAVQNHAVGEASGEILVFSDANAIYKSDAIKKLVRNFENPNISCVCGQLNYIESGKKKTVENLYWKYEKFLKLLESKVFSLIGVNGSIYAIRKSDYIPIGVDLISDLVEPLAIVRSGKRVIYEPEAISEEEAVKEIEMEFRRKVRILTRAMNGFWNMRVLFNPFRYGLFSVMLIFHKLFRYLTPFVLFSCCIALVFLTVRTVYFLFFLCLLILLISIVKFKLSGRPSFFKPIFSIVEYYVVMNYAVLIAWKNLIIGHKYVTWSARKD